MKKLTREWVGKGEADYRLAFKIARGSEPFPDQQCFHCQQAAEKYLKALLEELGRPIQRTHQLIDVLRDVLPITRRCESTGAAWISSRALPSARAIPVLAPPSVRPQPPSVGLSVCAR